MLFPGESVDPLIESQLANVTVKGKPVETIRLGPGLIHSISTRGAEQITAASAGTLQYRQPNKFWLNTPRRRRYIPHPGDLVIGRITVKTAEYLKVDLGGPHLAILPLSTGFEAATKRNRPNLSVGALVYCRVSQADRFIEPEVLCVDSDGKGNAFGELPSINNSKNTGFMMFSSSITKSWQLQRHDCPILTLLGKYLPFEIVIGANGRYAIESSSISLTLQIHHWIAANEAAEDQVKEVSKEYSPK